MSISQAKPDLVDELLNAIEEDLLQSIASLQTEMRDELATMISHHMGWEETNARRGKRIRPMLVLLTCGALHGDWRKAVPAASAVELVHNFSLVHDDIEDNSATRRGRPTIWNVWGIPQAINTGDALFVLARLAAHRLSNQGVPAQAVLKVMHLLDDACLQLTIGQHLDLTFETQSQVSEDDYRYMISGKTSALIASATASGAVIAGASEAVVEAMHTFGLHLGLAFQIQDDILGIWGKPEVTGKPAGDDLLNHKKSLPILHGLAISPTFEKLWLESVNGTNVLNPMRLALEEAGVLDFSRQQAKLHTDTALNALRSLEADKTFYTELYQMTVQLLDRSR